MKILSVTGTKGKTSVVRAISHVLHSLGETTLRVDTDGHYVKERQKSTLNDSRNLYTKAPTVCPGKYLITAKKYYPNFTAVFENSVGSNGKHGLGYSFHTVGIFTNVYEDHLSIHGKLNSKEALAEAKSFIFKNIDDGGAAVYNADDPLVKKQLEKIPQSKNVRLFAVTLKPLDRESLLEAQKKNISIFTLKDGWCILITPNESKKIIRAEEISWTFGGSFAPSNYNLLFTLAGLFALEKDVFSPRLLKVLKKYKLPTTGGRLTLLKNKQGVKVLIDYAHEKQSLQSVARMARQFTASHTSKVFGVIRLAPDRTNTLIKETGDFIANDFDTIIVYDKIDGVSRGRFVGKNSNFVREVGEVSQILAEAIQKKNKRVMRIIYEEDAIKEASLNVRPGDVVVHICGDDHKKTVAWVKKYFKAKRVA